MATVALQAVKRFGGHSVQYGTSVLTDAKAGGVSRRPTSQTELECKHLFLAKAGS